MGNKNTHTHTERYTMGYYSAIKRKNLPFATIQMDFESIMLSEISQRKVNTYDLTYMWNLKNSSQKQRGVDIITDLGGSHDPGKDSFDDVRKNH